MKNTIRRSMAVLTVLCCLVSLGTTAYAADEENEWGVIPDGYVLFVPAPQSTVRAEPVPNSGSGTHGMTAAPEKVEEENRLPAVSVPAEEAQSQPDQEPTAECAYTLEEFAAVHIAEINRLREENGLAPLETDPTLTEMAQERIGEYRWGHKRADGSLWYTIFDEYETNLRAAGENWIGSSSNPYSQIEALMNSDGHRANILNEDAAFVGIGVKWNEEQTAISVVQLYAK